MDLDARPYLRVLANAALPKSYIIIRLAPCAGHSCHMPYNCLLFTECLRDGSVVKHTTPSVDGSIHVLPVCLSSCA